MKIPVKAHRNELLSLLAKMLNGSHLTVGGNLYAWTVNPTVFISTLKIL